MPTKRELLEKLTTEELKGIAERNGVLVPTAAEYPWEIELEIEVEAIEPTTMRRLYRWRVETIDGARRVIAVYRRDDGQWRELRSPDRLAQLLALTPEDQP